MTKRTRKKIRLRKLGRVLIALFFLTALVVVSINYIKDNVLKEQKVEEKEEKIVIPEPKKEPKDYQASLFMVGDALIHSSIYEDAYTGSGYDFKPMLERIKPIASQYDLVYYNQETILGGPELGFSNYPRFNSPYEVGDAFIDAGFNLVSLATNHTMDKGEAGVLNSVNYWNQHKDKVVTSGQWTSFEERWNDISTIHEINGIKYAFLSYTVWTNGLETPPGKDYLNNVYSNEKALADIALVKGKADVIIVAMHWGTEYSLYVDHQQEEIAQFLSEQGVQIIIGAHPHVVEAVEWINDHKTFVIYSLGNLVSDQTTDQNYARLTGLMMTLLIKKHVDIDDTVTVTIEEPRAELVFTKSYMRRKRDFKIYPYPELNDELFPGYQSYYERYKAVVSDCYPELVWGLGGY